LPQNLRVEKDERQAKRFCRTGEARLALLGLVREKRRWRARAGRRRDGAFDEGGDSFAGAASFAANTDRHGGFAITEIILPLRSIVPLHVRHRNTLRDDADQFRLTVDPTGVKGLREISQMAIDKVTVIPRSKTGEVIGQADDGFLLRVNRALALFLGIVLLIQKRSPNPEPSTGPEYESSPPNRIVR
jgi:hypothetical protein